MTPRISFPTEWRRNHDDTKPMRRLPGVADTVVGAVAPTKCGVGSDRSDGKAARRSS